MLATTAELHIVARMLEYRSVDGALMMRPLYEALIRTQRVPRSSLVLGTWPWKLHYLLNHNGETFCYGCKTFGSPSDLRIIPVCFMCIGEFNNLRPVLQEMHWNNYRDITHMLSGFCAADQNFIIKILSDGRHYTQRGEHGILPQSYRQQLSQADVQSVESFVQYSQNTSQVPAQI